MENLKVIGGIVAAAVLIGGALLLTKSGEAPSKTVEPTLQHVHGFAVDVANPDRLLIATHHGLLEFSDNSLSQIGTAGDDLMGFTPHPRDASIFFSSGHPAGGGNLGFQKSTDGGLTWKKISDGMNGPVDFHSMTVSMANPDIVYGHFGKLQLSSDGGTTWEFAKGSVQPISLSTDPIEENIVYAATASGVLVSEDRADTWRSLSAQLDGGAVSVFAVSPDKTYSLAFSQALGGLGKSVDSGITWNKIDEAFNGEVLTFIAFSKTVPSTVYAFTQANSIYKSADKGATWTKLR